MLKRIFPTVIVFTGVMLAVESTYAQFVLTPVPGLPAVFFRHIGVGRLNAFVIISCLVTALNLQWHENTNLALANAWSPVSQPAVTHTGQISVTVPTTVGRKLFRSL